MKKCPHCNKEIPDYAKKCKYCDKEIPAYEPAGGGTTTALLCPTCGGSMSYDGTSARAVCAHCGNQVVVPSREKPGEDTVPLEEQNLPLSETVERLVREGSHDRAVALLRRNLSIQQDDAERVVAIIESGEYGDAKQLFQEAMQGRLK